MPVYGPCPNSMCLRQHRDGVVGRDANERVRHELAGGLCRRQRALCQRNVEADDETKRGRALEELPPVGGDGDVHAQPSIRPAASWMAALMRW